MSTLLSKYYVKLIFFVFLKLPPAAPANLFCPLSIKKPFYQVFVLLGKFMFSRNTDNLNKTIQQFFLTTTFQKYQKYINQFFFKSNPRKKIFKKICIEIKLQSYKIQNNKQNKRSHIWETKNLSTDADSSTAAMKLLTIFFVTPPLFYPMTMRGQDLIM